MRQVSCRYNSMRILSKPVLCIASLCLVFMSVSAARAANDIVISQVYGGGGNTGATYKNDFVELFNRGAGPVSLNGWSIQYAASAGNTWQKTNLPNVTLNPGQYLLVQEAAGSGGTAALPAADATGNIAMSASAGKVVLRSTNTAFLSGTSCPTGVDVIDSIGFGPATNCSEFSPTTPNLTNTTAALRVSAGCTDTDNNVADFSNGVPNPRNTAAPLSPCGAVNQPIAPSCPANLAVVTGAGALANLSASDADGYVSNAVISSTPVTGVALINAAAGSTLTAQLQVASSVLTGNYNVIVTFTNNDTTPQTANCTVAVNVAPPMSATRIHDIQGTAHISPRNGQSVTGVPGIVTLVSSIGFWMQDPSPDADSATSEGIFVYTAGAPSVQVGASVQVSGTVQEFRPGGSASDNLTTTEIVSPTVSTLSTGNSLPAATVLGAGGRAIPSAVIDNDATGDVETSGSFDAAADGIDFYESLEGMRVQINSPVASGPSNGYGETPMLADNGASAGVRSSRGGVVVSADDFNPERIIVDDTYVAVPTLDVGDGLSTVVGVLDYAFGDFMLYATNALTSIDNGPVPEVTSLVGTGAQLTVGSFNVENLDAADTSSKFSALANQIVNHLKAPDIVALMEVQDNNGPTNDSVVDAAATYNTLINAIQTAGGPTYQFRNINPADDQDGGEPGGNIRVGFLFNSARVSFTDRSGAGATTPNTVVNNAGIAQLQFSPGRIEPTNSAFNASRKPLAAEFVFNGRTVFVIANHFNSKGGDDPLFGHVQPPVRSSEVQRHQQAAIVSRFVQSILAVDENANVIVLGDMNDFEFSETLNILKTGSGLVDLVDSLPPSERYTYVFEGNSQVLDHILVSANLATNAVPEYDIVHVNSEYAAQTSDHEPEVTRLTLPAQVTGPTDVTSQVSVTRSGLTYKRKTLTYNGYITVANTGASPIIGPLQIVLENLTAGVSLQNAIGAYQGAPYVTSIGPLAPGELISVPVVFSNSANVSINYSTHIYSGNI